LWKTLRLRETLSLRRRDSVAQRPRHHDHTWTAAVRPIVDRAMNIMRKRARIPGAAKPASLSVRAPCDPGVGEHTEHLRKQGNDVETH
jgi:hypothetical protein